MPFAWPTRGVRALGTAASVSEADISLNGQCAPPHPLPPFLPSAEVREGLGLDSQSTKGTLKFTGTPRAGRKEH